MVVIFGKYLRYLLSGFMFTSVVIFVNYMYQGYTDSNRILVLTETPCDTETKLVFHKVHWNSFCVESDSIIATTAGFLSLLHL